MTGREIAARCARIAAEDSTDAGERIARKIAGEFLGAQVCCNCGREREDLKQTDDGMMCGPCREPTV